jgi:hypothetical protein
MPKRSRLVRTILAASLATTMVVTMALALSLTPGGQRALRSLAAVAGNRIFPWAPVSALADTTCGGPSTNPGGTGGQPSTNPGGTGGQPSTNPGGTTGGGPSTSSGGTTGGPSTNPGGTTGGPSTNPGGTCAPPPLTVTATETPGTVCFGAGSVLMATASGGTGPYTFAWSAGGPVFATGPTVTVTPGVTTTYTVVVTDSKGATATSSQIVTVDAPVKVGLSGPSGAILLGRTANLTASAGGGTGSFTYTWTKNGASSGGSGNSLADTPSLGDTTYAVTATDSDGCRASNTFEVRVFDYTLSMSPTDETVLAGTPASYTLNVNLVPGSDATGGPSVTVSLSGAPSGSSTVTSPTLSLTGGGSTGGVVITPTSLGDFGLMATGSVPGGSRIATANLHVFDFSLAIAPPSQTVPLGGGPASYTVSAPLVPGSTSVGLPSVGLGLSGLPGSITPTLAPSTSLNGSTSLNLAIGSTPPGTYNFTVTGAVPGGSRSASGQLLISYKICALYDQTQVKKAGSTIAIKLELCDAGGRNVSSSGVTVQATYLMYLSGSVPNVTPDDSGNANPDQDFRFDGSLATGGAYIYNLSTKGLSPGQWGLFFTAGADPTPHSVDFLLK